MKERLWYNHDSVCVGYIFTTDRQISVKSTMNTVPLKTLDLSNFLRPINSIAT